MQWRRKARKATGLPASQDAGFLAKMLPDLRPRVEEETGKAMESAVVVTWNLVALYHENLQDAVEYVRLRYLTLSSSVRCLSRDKRRLCRLWLWSLLLPALLTGVSSE